jgi:hypothetical protein
MARLFDKVTEFAQSPKGREALNKATAKAQQLASDPKTRARIDDVRRRFTGRRDPGGRSFGSGPGH